VRIEGRSAVVDLGDGVADKLEYGLTSMATASRIVPARLLARTGAIPSLDTTTCEFASPTRAGTTSRTIERTIDIQ